VVRARSSLGAAVAAVALASGAVVGAAPASAAVAPPGVKVTLKDGHVRLAPDTLRPGLYRFAVEVPGGAPDGLQLVRPRAGYSAAEFARDSDLVSSGTPTQARRAQRRLDANARMWGGLVVDGPATENFWQSLPAGRVFLVSQRRPREVRVVRVTGERRRTSVPGANAVIDVADGALTTTATALPTSGTVLVRNTGTETHVAGLAKLAPGKTIDDVRAYFTNIFGDPSNPDAPAPEDPFDNSEYGAAALFLDPGTREWLHYDLSAGSYALICYQLELETFEFHLVDGEMAAVTIG
jgi:hypothetical protein